MPLSSRQYRWDFPYLIDESRDFARAYDAACTGQFDDTRPRGGMVSDGGDLPEAVHRMIEGGEPPARPYPGSGCSIIWKQGKQPVWWNAGVSLP